jgi:hypothetical protein
MRKLLPAVFMITGTLLPLVVTSPSMVAAAESSWVLADDNAETGFYFDSTGVTTTSEGFFRVPVRVVYTDEGKADALEVLKHAAGFEKLTESRYSYDLDCKKMKSHLLSVAHLDDAGNRIKSVDLAADTEWEDIPPYSRLEALTDEVCPKK